ncbi:MAG: hypothetical protein ACRCWJ_11790 [Casimicrobium sp.]
MKQTKIKAERREFLRKAALGTMGLSAIATGLGVSEKAAARILQQKTTGHVDEFLQAASAGQLTPDAHQSHLAMMNQLKELLKANPALLQEAESIVNTLHASYPSGGAPANLGLTQLQSEGLSALYLATAEATDLEFLSRDELASEIMGLRNELEQLEPNFLEDLSAAITARISSDFNFSQSIAAASYDVEALAFAYNNPVFVHPPACEGRPGEEQPWIGIPQEPVDCVSAESGHPFGKSLRAKAAPVQGPKPFLQCTFDGGVEDSVNCFFRSLVAPLLVISVVRAIRKKRCRRRQRSC